MVPSERYGEIALKENEHGASVNVLQSETDAGFGSNMLREFKLFKA